MVLYRGSGPAGARGELGARTRSWLCCWFGHRGAAGALGWRRVCQLFCLLLSGLFQCHRLVALGHKPFYPRLNDIGVGHDLETALPGPHNRKLGVCVLTLGAFGTEPREIRLAKHTSNMTLATLGTVGTKPNLLEIRAFCHFGALIHVKIDALARLGTHPRLGVGRTLGHFAQIVLVEKVTVGSHLAQAPQPVLAHYLVFEDLGGVFEGTIRTQGAFSFVMLVVGSVRSIASAGCPVLTRAPVGEEPKGVFLLEKGLKVEVGPRGLLHLHLL